MPEADDPSGLNALTERIIGCAYRVKNTLGHGFVERVYENALAHEVRKAGLRVEQQCRAVVRYDGVVVGDFFAIWLSRARLSSNSRPSPRWTRPIGHSV